MIELSVIQTHQIPGRESELWIRAENVPVGTKLWAFSGVSEPGKTGADALISALSDLSTNVASTMYEELNSISERGVFHDTNVLHDTNDTNS